jgi:two-component sensor histidine kinase
MTRRWASNLLKFAGFSLIVTAAIFAIAMNMMPRAAPLFIAPNFAIYIVYAFASTFVYAFCIGGLCWLAMPRLAGRLEGKPALRWGILLGALIALGVLGTFLATLVMYYAYGFQLGVSLPTLFAQALRSALPITLIVGVITSIVKSGKGRLRASEAELQRQRVERERAEKLAAEARLASLSSRVQPHFLFNTLNSVAALIRENPAEAERTVERLASLLRSSLDNVETIPLDQEFKLVSDYLEIQKTRMGERLKFEIGMEPGIRAAVPPFSVQTLAENSLKHVAERRPQGVEIQIRAARAHGDVIVLVADNGPGFELGSMRAGSGLDNLQARLRATYGEGARMELLRQPERMTVRLLIPAG